MAQSLDSVTFLQLYLPAVEPSCCWACPWATCSFPGTELSSGRGLCYHRQCRLHSEQPAPVELCFEFQSREGQGFIRMGRNSRELSSQRQSAVSSKEAVSVQSLPVSSRWRVADTVFEACWGCWGCWGKSGACMVSSGMVSASVTPGWPQAHCFFGMD